VFVKADGEIDAWRDEEDEEEYVGMTPDEIYVARRTKWIRARIEKKNNRVVADKKTELEKVMAHISPHHYLVSGEYGGTGAVVPRPTSTHQRLKQPTGNDSEEWFFRTLARQRHTKGKSGVGQVSVKTPSTNRPGVNMRLPPVVSRSISCPPNKSTIAFKLNKAGEEAKEGRRGKRVDPQEAIRKKIEAARIEFEHAQQLERVATENRVQLQGILEMMDRKPPPKLREVTPPEKKSRVSVDPTIRDPGKIANIKIQARLEAIRCSDKLAKQQARIAKDNIAHFAPKVSPLGHKYIQENADTAWHKDALRCPVPINTHYNETLKRNSKLLEAKERYKKSVDRKWHEARIKGNAAKASKIDDMVSSIKEKRLLMWYPRLLGGSRANVMLEAMLANRERMRIEGDRDAAARKIQNTYRVIWYQKYKRRRIMRGFKSFGRVLSRYVVRFRAMREENAVTKILSMLGAIGKANKIVTTIRHYVGRVQKIQRFYRRFVEWKSFHTGLWGLQFAECEGEALLKYRSKVEKIKADMKHNTGVDKEEKANKAQKAGVNIYAEPDSIREEIRNRVILNHFVEKHKNHVIALQEWAPEYDKFMVKFRKAEAMDKSWKAVSGKLDHADSMVLKLKPCSRPEMHKVIPALELVDLLKGARGIQEAEDNAALMAKAKASEDEKAAAAEEKPGAKKSAPFK